MKMYHGTTHQAAELIRASRMLIGPVYLTSRIDMALSYGEVAIEVDIDPSRLSEDYDTENPDDDMTTIEWSRAGRSVYVGGDVALLTPPLGP